MIGSCFLQRTVSSFEPEHSPHEIFYGLAGRIRRGFVVARVRIDLHAWVLVGERLAGLGIDGRSERLFLEIARAHALRALRYGRRRVAERIVVAVMRAGVLG